MMILKVHTLVSLISNGFINIHEYENAIVGK